MVKRTNKNPTSWDRVWVCSMSCQLILSSSLALQFPIMQDTAPAGQKHVRDRNGKARPQDLQTPVGPEGI